MALVILNAALHQACTPLLYHLGEHTLFITQEPKLMIEIADSAARETVQLDSEEAYRLYVSLHALFTQLAANV